MLGAQKQPWENSEKMSGFSSDYLDLTQLVWRHMDHESDSPWFGLILIRLAWEPRATTLYPFFAEWLYFSSGQEA